MMPFTRGPLTPRRAVVAGSLTLALAAGGATAAVASTSHAGWPVVGKLSNGKPNRIINRTDANRTLSAPDPDGHAELLGGHGNDTINAGHKGDILWGDYKPGAQPTSQIDHINGGAGKDFIYASHGTNFISTGGGADQVHAHFGSGKITCAGGNPTIFLSHKSRKHYKLSGCKRISYKTVGY